MNIKYGDIEYFTLVDLQDKLKRFDYDKLDLQYLNNLRNEINLKIEAIHLIHKQSKEKRDEIS